MMPNRTWYVYMLRCGDDSLYTGVTLDISKRYDEHRLGKGARYTRARKVVELVYWVALDSKSRAYQTEYRIKQLARAGKELIVARQWEQQDLLAYLKMEDP
jgi:putative endonuclease